MLVMNDNECLSNKDFSNVANTVEHQNLKQVATVSAEIIEAAWLNGILNSHILFLFFIRLRSNTFVNL
jgi:hypothetical protein